MALFQECTQWCAHIMLDRVDVVREGMLLQLATSALRVFGYIEA
jgi:hypothetical protein